jgi:hypothetical protein
LSTPSTLAAHRKMLQTKKIASAATMSEILAMERKIKNLNSCLNDDNDNDEVDDLKDRDIVLDNDIIDSSLQDNNNNIGSTSKLISTNSLLPDSTEI